MVKTLGDLHGSYLQGIQGGMPQVVAFAHFDLIAQALGENWQSTEATLETMQRIFPEQIEKTDPRLSTFGGLRMYQSCRQAMFKLVVEMTEEDIDDPFSTLRILGEAAGIRSALSDLKAPLTSAFGMDVRPSCITRDKAIEVDATLVGASRRRFRRALVLLDQLRRLPQILDKNILLPEPIGSMPRYTRSGGRIQELPPNLLADCLALKAADSTAFKATYTIGVAAGVLNPNHDVAPLDFLIPSKQACLAQLLLAKFPGKTGRIYLNRVTKAVCDAYPIWQHPEPWEALEREASKKTKAFSSVAWRMLRSRLNGVSPKEVTQEMISQLLAAEPSSRIRANLVTAVQTLLELQNAGDEDLSRLLPRTLLEPPWPQQTTVLAKAEEPADEWADLLTAVKNAGLSKNDVHAIGSVRSQAQRSQASVSPRDLTKDWACDRLAVIKSSSTRMRFRRGIGCLDEIRKTNKQLGNLPKQPIGPLPDGRRRGNIALPQARIKELNAHFEFRGLSPNARRSISTAVTSIFCQTRKKDIFEKTLSQIPFDCVILDIERSAKSCPRTGPGQGRRDCSCILN